MKELDALVAERVMGWIWNDVSAWSPTGSRWDINGDWLPPYSTDIATAWSVIDKLKIDGWDCVISVMNHGVMVRFVHYGYKCEATAKSDIASRAICTAAIRAVEVQKEVIEERRSTHDRTDQS